MSGELPVTVETDSLDAQYVVIDVETTGLDVLQGHGICELAALRLVGDRFGEVYSTLVNPGRPIPPDATAVNRITDDMVREAPTMGTVAVKLLDFLGAGSVIVMHNAPFDMGFIQSKLRELGLPRIANLVIDTLDLARREFGPGGNSLGQLAKRLSLRQGAAHRAQGDVETAARLFLHFRNQCRMRGLLSVGALGARSGEYFAAFLSSGRPPGPSGGRGVPGR
jgi:DNA polymerase III epsilon subunit family exonuclease